jgi:hypothetical protein
MMVAQGHPNKLCCSIFLRGSGLHRVGVISHPPGDQQSYEAIRDKVWRGGTSEGPQFDAAGESDGRWHIIKVWESRDGLEQFIREDLVPAFDEVIGAQHERPQLVTVTFLSPSG